jgi:hypothetical protein
MSKWIAEFELEDGDTMPEHMDLEYKGAKIDFHCRPMWIPCSERLPAKTGHYLCSFKEPNRIDNIFVDLAYWTGSRWYGYLANEINAWMPLPDRYEAERESE